MATNIFASNPPLASPILQIGSPNKVVSSPTPTADTTLIHSIQFPRDYVIKSPPREHYVKLSTYSRTRPRRRRILQHCQRIICASICTIILVLILLAIIVYATFRPKPPSYSLTSLSISGFDPLLSSPFTPLNPYINARLRTENPNKRISVVYQTGGSISVSFDKVELCNGDWPAWVQKPGNTTQFETDLNGSGILLTSSTRNEILTAENNSLVPLTMDAKFPVKIKYKFVRSWSVTVKVSCDVKVDSLNTTANVISKKCHVNTHYLW
ncbi:hypothetical protein LUZ60_015511 [Juncus effusus]|nr:hypothetical protein LUZ60_015511 [Juncus effusus]